jgi:hypothetical protein
LKNILEKEYNIAISLFFGDTIRQKKKRNSKRTIKNITIAYYTNGCLRFSTFMFLNIAKFLANYTYGGSPLEQHHKTEKTTLVHVVR